MKEKKKREALRRMSALGLRPNAIEMFRDEGEICVSRPGVGYCEMSSEYEDLVRKLENEFNCMVYHLIYSGSGEFISALYVSESEEEWMYDFCDAMGGYPIAYVFNINHLEFSEFGYISIEENDGILKRIG